MEFFDNLAVGFGVALNPANLGFAFIGAMVGTLIGVLPGIGPIATIAMLLPLTFHLEPVSGLIMLAGIFYGAQYGGSTPANLVNLPGETPSAGTCLAGHPMAGQGPSWVSCQVRPRRWCPASTATRWRGRAAPVRRLRSRRSARSLPAAFRPR